MFAEKGNMVVLDCGIYVNGQRLVDYDNCEFQFGVGEMPREFEDGIEGLERGMEFDVEVPSASLTQKFKSDLQLPNVPVYRYIGKIYMVYPKPADKPKPKPEPQSKPKPEPESKPATSSTSSQSSSKSSEVQQARAKVRNFLIEAKQKGHKAVNLKATTSANYRHHYSVIATEVGIGVYCDNKKFMTFTNAHYKAMGSPANLVISDFFVSIGKSALEGCDTLQSVVIPDSVTTIEFAAFQRCRNLTSAKLPNGLRVIGQNQFNGCYKLSSVSIPNGVEEISSGAFSDCKSLTFVHIPSGVKVIGQGAFGGCEKLAGVKLPDTVKRIDSYAFARCLTMKEFTIPNSVIEFGSSVFNDNVNLKNLYISKTSPIYDLIASKFFKKNK